MNARFLAIRGLSVLALLCFMWSTSLWLSISSPGDEAMALGTLLTGGAFFAVAYMLDAK